MTPGRVFHCSKALGRSFQSIEWSEYCQEHPFAASEAVATSHGFSWNVFDVCLDPKQVIDWKNKFCSMRVAIAQSPNTRYSYEFNIAIHVSYYSHGAFYCDKPKEGFDTEKAAVFDALSVAERYANQTLKECYGREDVEDENGSIRYKSAIPYIKDCLKVVANFKDQYDVRQLELF